MIIESYTAGTPSWVDLMTSDQDAAIAFYGDLFGWQALKSGPEMGNYAMCMKGDHTVAGIGVVPDDQSFPPSWTTYISVDDADAVVAAALAAGGQVMAPAMTIEGGGQVSGRMAVLADPSGGVFGIWEPHDHRGSGLANEPGSFAWNELLSLDPQGSRDFLATVFGYEWEAMENSPMEYFSGQVDGRAVLGVMGMPPNMPDAVPSHWNTYFAVADADDVAARAVASGGTLLGEVSDTPFGRMAVIEDPQGATFSIMSMPAS
ncbi:MAG: VOC family protein [Candidatus Nanopelagicales bacterium]